MAKALTLAAAMEIKRLYAEVDWLGRRKHTQMEIAMMLGVGETTVFRVLKNAGAYQKLQHMPTDEQTAESLKRVMADVEVQKALQRQGDTLVEELKGERSVPDAGY